MDEDAARSGTITDEALADMRGHLGRYETRAAWNASISAEGIEHFAVGIGDDNPLWLQPDYCAATVWGHAIAPPCYLYSHMYGSMLRPGQDQLSVDIYLPGVLGIWGAEKWAWRRPARTGERISARTALVEAEPVVGSSFGARSIRQVERTEFVSEDGELVAENLMTIQRYERAAVGAKSKYLDRELATYSGEQRAEIAELYARESRRGAQPRPVHTVKNGDPMGVMTKGPLTVSNMIAYLAGVGTALIFANRMHYGFLATHPSAALIHPGTGIVENVEAPHWDSPMAAAYSGLPAGYDMGAQRFCWFSHFVSDWMGDAGFVVEMETRLRRPNLLGDLTTLTGEVTEVFPEAHRVHLSMKATNQLGEVTATSTAIVDLSRCAA